MEQENKVKEFCEMYGRAGQGDPEAMLYVANSYSEGYGVEQDYEKSRFWYEKGAELGNPGAICGLGCIYFYGNGVEADSEKAKELFLRSADMGFSGAFLELGNYYFVSEDYVTAISYYEKASDEAEAMNTIGDIYYFSFGSVEEDVDKAFVYYLKASELGDDPEYCFNVGMCYDDENFSNYDPKKANEYYAKCLELDPDYKEAIYAIASNLYLGNGMEADEKRAIELYERAAELGEVDAMKELGGIYITEDPEKGLRYYKMAAEAGDESAIRIFEEMKDSGVSVDAKEQVVQKPVAAKPVAQEPDSLGSSSNLMDEPDKDSKKKVSSDTMVYVIGAIVALILYFAFKGC